MTAQSRWYTSTTNLSPTAPFSRNTIPKAHRDRQKTRGSIDRPPANPPRAVRSPHKPNTTNQHHASTRTHPHNYSKAGPGEEAHPGIRGRIGKSWCSMRPPKLSANGVRIIKTVVSGLEACSAARRCLLADGARHFWPYIKMQVVYRDLSCLFSVLGLTSSSSSSDSLISCFIFKTTTCSALGTVCQPWTLRNLESFKTTAFWVTEKPMKSIWRRLESVKDTCWMMLHWHMIEVWRLLQMDRRFWSHNRVTRLMTHWIGPHFASMLFWSSFRARLFCLIMEVLRDQWHWLHRESKLRNTNGPKSMSPKSMTLIWLL